MKQKKKNILILHGSNDLYGASYILLQVINILKENGYKLHIILPYSGPLDNILKENNVQVSFFNLGILRKKYLTFFGLFNRIFKIRKAVNHIEFYIKRHNIDTVYSNGSVILAGGFAAKKCQIKSIYHFHEIPTNKIYIKIMGLMVNTLSDRVVVVSNAVKECWEKCFDKGQIIRIYNGINSCDSKNKIVNNEKYTLTSIGRILPLKGHKYLIEIAKLLVKKELKFRVNIIGDTFKGYEKYEQELKDLVSKYNLEEHFFFLGFLKDVSVELSKTDLFIHPSIFPDSLPTVILEAMSHNIPVVATNLGGNCELVDNGNSGMLIPFDDAAIAAEIIFRYLKNTKLQQLHVKRSQEMIGNLFSESMFKSNILKIFNEVI